MIISTEGYIAELNRYSTPEIARIFKVSETTVERWKAGQDTDSPEQKAAVVQVLNGTGTPIIASRKRLNDA